MDDFNILIGQYNASAITLTDAEYQGVQLDVNGGLILSGRHLEDTAHTSGDPGLGVLAVRTDVEGSLVDTDGDYAPLQVDSLGRLRVITDIDNVNIDFNSEKAEDSAHVSGDIGAFMLGVRRDVRAAGSSADGDYSSLNLNAVGELWVKDADALAKLTEIDTVLDTIASNIGDIDTNIADLKQTEDTAHTSGDFGVMSLGVRNDADADLTDADGDYSPIAVDSKGRVKTVGETTITVAGTEAYAVTDALAAAGDGLETITAAATPWVTVASVAVGAGTTGIIYGWQWACDQNAQARIVTDDTTDIIVYKNDVNSSAMPSSSEHFAKEGRIEIPGAASLEVKLQIKKRSVPGGNARGTGSLHMRIES